MWYVYILECQNKALYTGVTTDLDRRFEEHRSGKGGRFTKSFSPSECIYHERFLSKQAAFEREAQIKGWTRNKKLALIKDDLTLLKKL